MVFRLAGGLLLLWVAWKLFRELHPAAPPAPVDDPDTPQNEGSGFKGSTLLRLLNQGDYEGAADQLPRWNKAGGRVNPVLVGRRGRERDLFLTPDE